RFEFRLASYLLRPDSQFKLELTSTDAAATLWVNGHELQPEKAKAGKRDYWLPPKSSSRAASSVAAAPEEAGLAAKVTSASSFLRAGKNVLAVRVMPIPSSADVLLGLRLDAIRKPEGLADLAEEV